MILGRGGSIPIPDTLGSGEAEARTKRGDSSVGSRRDGQRASPRAIHKRRQSSQSTTSIVLPSGSSMVWARSVSREHSWIFAISE